MHGADAILLRCACDTTVAQFEALKKLSAEAGAAGARAYGNAEETLVYFDLAAPQPVKPETLAALETKARALLGGAQCSSAALEQVYDAAGASAGYPAPIHYVVEMDFAPGAADELNKWYAKEHMPGLGSVPGCVHTRRYMSAAGRSYACYDLVASGVSATPQWMKMRSTPWTERVREHYRNLTRGVYRKY